MAIIIDWWNKEVRKTQIKQTRGEKKKKLSRRMERENLFSFFLVDAEVQAGKDLRS